jgi:hypothetical protein
VGHGEAGMRKLYHTPVALDLGRVRAGIASQSQRIVVRSVKRVVALVEGLKRKEPVMSVMDCEIDEPDTELCEEHMHYRPCRACKRQADIERAEAMKDE